MSTIGRSVHNICRGQGDGASVAIKGSVRTQLPLRGRISTVPDKPEGGKKCGAVDFKMDNNQVERQVNNIV